MKYSTKKYSSQNSTSSQDLQHAQVIEHGTDEDEILNEEHKDELQDNLQYDLQNELHDEIEAHDEEDDDADVDEDDEETDDDSILGEDVDKRLTPHCSLLGRKGSFTDNKASIPKEFVGASTSCAEQVSLDSDLTNSLARNKKYLMSDEDL